MNRLDTEHQRLFGADGTTRTHDRVRHMVLGVSGPADWPALGAVWRGVQADLDLPAPAIAVNGVDAFELWFSLADPLSAEQAATFLEALCRRYLSDVAAARRRLWPTHEAGLSVEPARIPQLQGTTGRWSAFVAPDLAAVFGDDPSLDLPPGDDAQADQLSRQKPITRSEIEAAMARLAPEPAPVVAARPAGPPGARDDPRRFLLDVMNDPSVAMALRIQAAQALLKP